MMDPIITLPGYLGGQIDDAVLALVILCVLYLAFGKKIR